MMLDVACVFCGDAVEYSIHEYVCGVAYRPGSNCGMERRGIETRDSGFSPVAGKSSGAFQVDVVPW